jgi:hypothetical protein
MSQENVDRAKRAYAATNDAYRTGAFRRVIAEFLDREIVLIVPFTLGGRASFSGLLDVYANLDAALEAAGVEE